MPDDPVLHQQLMVGIARVEEQVKGVFLRLDKIDGHIGKLFERVDVAEINLLQHVIQCPVKPIVSELQRIVAIAKDAETIKHVTWTTVLIWAKPFIIAFFMTLLALIAIHFDVLRNVKP